MGEWPSVTSGLAAIVPAIPGTMSRGPHPGQLDSNTRFAPDAMLPISPPLPHSEMAPMALPGLADGLFWEQQPGIEG